MQINYKRHFGIVIFIRLVLFDILFIQMWVANALLFYREIGLLYKLDLIFLIHWFGHSFDYSCYFLFYFVSIYLLYLLKYCPYFQLILINCLIYRANIIHLVEDLNFMVYRHLNKEFKIIHFSKSL